MTVGQRAAVALGAVTAGIGAAATVLYLIHQKVPESQVILWVVAFSLVLTVVEGVLLQQQSGTQAPAGLGIESIVGQRVRVVEGFEPSNGTVTGRVSLGGELWRAELPGGSGAAHPGEELVVREVDGLCLKVERCNLTTR